MSSAIDRDALLRVLRDAGLRLDRGLEPRVADAVARAAREQGARDGAELVARAAAGDPDARLALTHGALVGETWFFRDLTRLALVRDVAVPAALAARGRARIWSCACSTGEEAWSVASLALSVPGASASRLEIVATDLDERALERARRGEYRAWSLRQAPDDLADAALERAPGGLARVRDPLRAVVSFERLNLVDVGRGAVPPRFRAPWDVVLCRNVLMYLEPELATSVLRALAGSLAPGGALILGAAEPPIPPELSAWVRGDLGGNVLVRPPADPPAAEVASDVALPREPERAASPAPRPRRPAARRAPAIAAPRPPETLVEAGPAADDPIARAVELADAGRTEDALAALEHLLAQATDARALTVRAMILESIERHAEAAEDAERAMVLAGERIEPALVAARARARLGDQERALRWVERARRRAAHMTATDTVEWIPEATRATVTALLDAIERRVRT